MCAVTFVCARLARDAVCVSVDARTESAVIVLRRRADSAACTLVRLHCGVLQSALTLPLSLANVWSCALHVLSERCAIVHDALAGVAVVVAAEAVVVRDVMRCVRVNASQHMGGLTPCVALVMRTDDSATSMLAHCSLVDAAGTMHALSSSSANTSTASTAVTREVDALTAQTVTNLNTVLQSLTERIEQVRLLCVVRLTLPTQARVRDDADRKLVELFAFLLSIMLFLQSLAKSALLRDRLGVLHELSTRARFRTDVGSQDADDDGMLDDARRSYRLQLRGVRVHCCDALLGRARRRAQCDVRVSVTPAIDAHVVCLDVPFVSTARTVAVCDLTLCAIDATQSATRSYTFTDKSVHDVSDTALWLDGNDHRLSLALT
jgi:hypothetical protein